MAQDKTFKQIISELMQTSQKSEDLEFLKTIASDLTFIADEHVRLFQHALAIRKAVQTMHDTNCQNVGSIAFQLTQVEIDIEHEIQNSTVQADVLAMLPTDPKGADQ